MQFSEELFYVNATAQIFLLFLILAPKTPITPGGILYCCLARRAIQLNANNFKELEPD